MELKEWCDQNNIMYLCTAFDIDKAIYVDQKLNVPIFKISSGENLTKDLIEYIASQNKPILLSTGMTSFEEIGLSLSILTRKSDKNITVLHCVSNYPANDDEINLNTLREIQERYNCEIRIFRSFSRKRSLYGCSYFRSNCN